MLQMDIKGIPTRLHQITHFVIDGRALKGEDRLSCLAFIHRFQTWVFRNVPEEEIPFWKHDDSMLMEVGIYQEHCDKIVGWLNEQIARKEGSEGAGRSK